jgi:hypothetical protein
MAYFPLIRGRPHRKRRLQQLFVASVKCLHIHCIAMNDTRTDPQTDPQTRL